MSSEKDISIEEQRHLWVQEYVRINHKCVTSGTWVWQSTAFLVGGAIASAGLILSIANHGFYTFIGAYILGMSIIAILWLFLNWFIRHERWRQYVLHTREEEIEKELNLYAGRYFVELDNKHKGENVSKDWSPEVEGFRPSMQAKLAELDKKYVPIGGFDFIEKAVWLTMLLWIVIIVKEFVQWLCYRIASHQLSEAWANHCLPTSIALLVIGVVGISVMFCRVGIPSCSIDKSEKKSGEQKVESVQS
jgi:hypothetical protein